MLGFVAGLLVANAGEWVMHKYVLHGLGRDRSSYWSFHWHDHHQSCRRHRFHDEAYHRSVFEPGGKAKEALGLLSVAAAVSPLAPMAPAFVAGLWASGAAYYLVHRQSHLDPEWARKWVPWHYDHHMGANQDANWCVTFPLFDYVMGTRIPYVGTERELRLREREQARRTERSGAQSGESAVTLDPVSDVSAMNGDEALAG